MVQVNNGGEMNSPTDMSEDPEFSAMRIVYSSLKDLDNAAQQRVLDYVCRRLNLVLDSVINHASEERTSPTISNDGAPTGKEGPSEFDDSKSNDDELEGISPIARKWMRRNGLSGQQLSQLFTLGVDEIDLVAKSVPGASRAERVRSVMLLQGIAAYLGSGTARITNETLRQACSHYDAYDPTNFSKHLKAIAAEASGSRESGYTLTSRGISAATQLIRDTLNIT
jgi:hypothetical protein